MIESLFFKVLMANLDALSDYISSEKRPKVEDDEDNGENNYDVCDFLKISQRTLQLLRTNQAITIPRLAGSIEIRLIERLLKEKAIKSADECFH